MVTKDRFWIVVEKDNTIITSTYKDTLDAAKHWSKQFIGCKITIFDEMKNTKVESNEQLSLF